MLDRKMAVGADQRGKVAGDLHRRPAAGLPRLRVVKVASTPFAEPGDEVAFTIRFDNVGNQVLGNVAILDSLSTRLEYIAGSAQCSREAQFTTAANEGDSVVLRCELADPLKAGHGRRVALPLPGTVRKGVFGGRNVQIRHFSAPALQRNGWCGIMTFSREFLDSRGIHWCGRVSADVCVHVHRDLVKQRSGGGDLSPPGAARLRQRLGPVRARPCGD